MTTNIGGKSDTMLDGMTFTATQYPGSTVYSVYASHSQVAIEEEPQDDCNLEKLWSDAFLLNKIKQCCWKEEWCHTADLCDACGNLHKAVYGY